ncbi:MFS transporter [Achromobacter aloeverae]|nr:MFS transporter [Achromobacter aloeverae]
MSHDHASPSPLLTQTMVLLMAVATGLIVASNYYAQPLLHAIGTEYGLGSAGAAVVVTVAQGSYAVGLMLLVPLGDRVERRALITVMTLIAAAGQALVAYGPGMASVLAGTAITGATSVVAQVLVPFAATLAAPQERGRVVGTIMSGLLLGVLLGRTVAGLLADLGDWRTVYRVAAVLLVFVAGGLWRVLPRHAGTATMAYPALVRSVGTLFVQEPLFRARSIIGALSFAQFSVLWTSLTFLLANPPYAYSNGTIGLFGLAGAIGAAAARVFGRMADSGHANRSTRLGLWLLVLSWPLLGLGAGSILALLAGILVLDLAAQALQVTNQACIYRLRPEARSRLTAGYMTAYFIGGALGSLASAAAYAHGGWLAVCGLGLALSVAGLLYGSLAPHARAPELAGPPKAA